MTVSHIFYSRKLVDAHVNYQEASQGKILSYDVNDPDLNELILCTALGSKATFSYTPTIDDILDYKGIKGDKNRKNAEDTISEEEKKKISLILVEAEKELPF